MWPKEVVREWVEFAALIIKWGGLVVGGFCFFVYLREIEYFPEGVSFGDSLLLFLVSAWFLMIYGLYWLLFTCPVLLGMIIVAAFRNGIRYVWARMKKTRPDPFNGIADPLMKPGWFGLILGLGLLGVVWWILKFYIWYSAHNYIIWIVSIAYFLIQCLVMYFFSKNGILIILKFYRMPQVVVRL